MWVMDEPEGEGQWGEGGEGGGGGGGGGRGRGFGGGGAGEAWLNDIGLVFFFSRSSPALLSVENWEEHVLDTAFTTRRFPVVLSHLEVLLF